MNVDPNFIQFLEDRLAEFRQTQQFAYDETVKLRGGDVTMRHLDAAERYGEAKGRAEGLAIAIGHAVNWKGKQS